jgi:hypothetical protein
MICLVFIKREGNKFYFYEFPFENATYTITIEGLLATVDRGGSAY